MSAAADRRLALLAHALAHIPDPNAALTFARKAAEWVEDSGVVARDAEIAPRRPASPATEPAPAAKRPKLPPRNAWPPDKIARFKEMWAAGRRAVEIAQEMGVSESRVFQVAKKLGVAPRRRRRPTPGQVAAVPESPEAARPRAAREDPAVGGPTKGQDRRELELAIDAFKAKGGTVRRCAPAYDPNRPIAADPPVPYAETKFAQFAGRRRRAKRKED